MNEKEVIDTIQAAHEAAFAWGQSDCFTFAMDVVMAVTGIDPYADERGTYTTPVGAALRLRARGFDSLDDAFAALWAPILPSMAYLGDIGITHTDDGPAAIVHDGNGWVGRAEGQGLIRVPLSQVAKAYRIV